MLDGGREDCVIAHGAVPVVIGAFQDEKADVVSSSSSSGESGLGDYERAMIEAGIFDSDAEQFDQIKGKPITAAAAKVLKDYHQKREEKAKPGQAGQVSKAPLLGPAGSADRPAAAGEPASGSTAAASSSAAPLFIPLDADDTSGNS